MLIPKTDGGFKERKSAAREADKLWSELITMPKRCAHCGRRDSLTPAHILKRKYRHTRWDPMNGICLCVGCHNYFEEHRSAWRNFVDFMFPGRLDALEYLKNLPGKPDPVEAGAKLKAAIRMAGLVLL